MDYFCPVSVRFLPHLLPPTPHARCPQSHQTGHGHPGGGGPFRRRTPEALRALDRNAEALVGLEEAIVIALRMYRNDHPQTARSTLDYGSVLMNLKRYPEAEESMLAAFDVILAGLGAQHKNARDAAGLLVKLYEKMGEPQKANQYREYSKE